MIEFKKGDRVHLTNGCDVDGTIIYVPGDRDECYHCTRDDGATGGGDPYNGYGCLWRVSDKDTLKLLSRKQEDNKMELNEIKAKNLEEAKKQYETEKANAEIEYAKRIYRIEMDNIDMYDREIAKYTKLKEEAMERLKPFTKK